MTRYPRNEALERLIQETNDILEPAEMSLGPYTDTRFPVVLVVGAPRSGTTLMTQWLAGSGAFGYPTNLMSRFSRAPALAARIQLLLTDPAYALGDELAGLTEEMRFDSSLGKTRGALSPNGFWFFWRRFLAASEIRHLTDEELAATRIEELRFELAAIESVFDKPLAMKGMMLQYNLEAFAAMLPRAFFLHIERDGVYTAQSLLRARESYYGTRESWYSARPREYERLKTLPPPSQVAGQVYYTNRTIRRDLDRLPQSRSMRVEHRSFCEDPSKAWRELQSKLQTMGYELPAGYDGPGRFTYADRDRLPAPEMQELRSAWQSLVDSAD